MVHSSIVQRVQPVAEPRYERARQLAKQIEDLLDELSVEPDARVRYELRLARALTQSLIDQLATLPEGRVA